MPKDKNIIILSGIIGDDAKFGKTKEGKEYYTFSLSVNAYSKHLADGTERTHSQTYVRIFCYDKAQLEYLKKVSVHRGQRANIFGRIASAKNEYKGVTFMTNNIVCRDIEIVHTKKVFENNVND